MTSRPQPLENHSFGSHPHHSHNTNHNNNNNHNYHHLPGTNAAAPLAGLLNGKGMTTTTTATTTAPSLQQRHPHHHHGAAAFPPPSPSLVPSSTAFGGLQPPPPLSSTFSSHPHHLPPVPSPLHPSSFSGWSSSSSRRHVWFRWLLLLSLTAIMFLVALFASVTIRSSSSSGNGDDDDGGRQHWITPHSNGNSASDSALPSNKIKQHPRRNFAFDATPPWRTRRTVHAEVLIDTPWMRLEEHTIQVASPAAPRDNNKRAPSLSTGNHSLTNDAAEEEEENRSKAAKRRQNVRLLKTVRGWKWLDLPNQVNVLPTVTWEVYERVLKPRLMRSARHATLLRALRAQLATTLGSRSEALASWDRYAAQGILSSLDEPTTTSSDELCVVFLQEKYGYEGRSLAVVGGAIEKGEAIENAARRELEEELDLHHCETFERLGTHRTDVNRGGGFVSAFLARRCDSHSAAAASLSQTERSANSDLEDQQILVVTKKFLWERVVHGGGSKHQVSVTGKTSVPKGRDNVPEEQQQKQKQPHQENEVSEEEEEISVADVLGEELVVKEVKWSHTILQGLVRLGL